jgi:hypothetical protein
MLRDKFYTLLQQCQSLLLNTKRGSSPSTSPKYTLLNLLKLKEQIAGYDPQPFAKAIGHCLKESVFYTSSLPFYLRSIGKPTRSYFPIDSRDNLAHQLLLNHFLDDFISESPYDLPTELDVRNLSGVFGSRSSGRNLQDIAFNWSHGDEVYYCESHEQAVQKLAAILKRHSQTHLRITRRMWDDRYFWGNSDGSHRMSGILRFAIEHKTSVILPVTINTVTLNPQVLTPFLESYDLFLVPEQTGFEISRLFREDNLSTTNTFISRDDTFRDPRATKTEKEAAITVDLLALYTHTHLAREIAHIIRTSPCNLDISAYLRQAALTSLANSKKSPPYRHP